MNYDNCDKRLWSLRLVEGYVTYPWNQSDNLGILVNWLTVVRWRNVLAHDKNTFIYRVSSLEASSLWNTSLALRRAVSSAKAQGLSLYSVTSKFSSARDGIISMLSLGQDWLNISFRLGELLAKTILLLDNEWKIGSNILDKFPAKIRLLRKLLRNYERRIFPQSKQINRCLWPVKNWTTDFLKWRRCIFKVNRSSWAGLFRFLRMSI